MISHLSVDKVVALIVSLDRKSAPGLVEIVMNGSVAAALCIAIHTHQPRRNRAEARRIAWASVRRIRPAEALHTDRPRFSLAERTSSLCLRFAARAAMVPAQYDHPRRSRIARLIARRRPIDAAAVRNARSGRTRPSPARQKSAAALAASLNALLSAVSRLHAPKPRATSDKGP